MARLGEKYYEIGRGYEHISDAYKRPYLLGVDVTDKQKPFVVAQGDHHSDTFACQLSIVELLSDKWVGHLRKANCLAFRQTLEVESRKGSVYPTQLFNKIIQEISTSLKLNHNWVSTEMIEVLDYDTNFSNWIDAEAAPGFFKFQLNLAGDAKNCHLKIPTIDITGREGHYSIYYGRFQLKNNQILIWQNETTPVKIEFSLSNMFLKMHLFGRTITFKHE